MEGLRAYRLLPVPMRLDDPRWRRSWRQKPCLVYHVSEGRARGAAARFFAVEGVGVFTGFPWDDLALVMCEAREIVRWVTGPVGGKVYTASGGDNPRIGILSDAALSKDRPWTAEVLKAARNGVGNVRHPQARELGEAFDRFAQQALAGQGTPEDSLKRIGAEMRQALGNAASCR